MNGAPKRTKNREVENEIVCPPEKAGQPPRPVTEPSSEEYTSELQSLMRTSYAFFCLKNKIHDRAFTSTLKHSTYSLSYTVPVMDIRMPRCARTSTHMNT